jgi:hypothetical protein
MANGDSEQDGGPSGALSLYQLIGAPLHALVEAEAQAAMATARFVELVGFDGTKEPADGTGSETASDWGQLRVARFRQQLQRPDGGIEERTIEIPTLSLVPIPALQIKNAELEYVVKIIDTEVYRAKPGGLPRSAAKEVAGAKTADGDDADLPEHQVDLKVAFARDSSVTSGRRSLDMQVKMKVNVEQADLPSGIARLINLMDQGVNSGPARPVIEGDETSDEPNDPRNPEPPTPSSG